MRRPQFTIRALLVAMLVVAAFFGGARVERERRRRANEAAAIAVKTQRTMRNVKKRINIGGFEFSYRTDAERQRALESVRFGHAPAPATTSNE